MGNRVLVGYATRNGATVGVAEAIGRTLESRGFDVDVRPFAEHPIPSDYDFAVLGSAINGGRWLPEALSYVEANEEALRAMPTATFCVHAMNCGDTEKKSLKRRAYIDEVRARIAPAAEGYFAGVGPLSGATSVFAGWAFRAFGGDVEGDGRDWEKIDAWAQGLAV
jgi:menaquinone-dependent protoporphyrinogen oxidase